MHVIADRRCALGVVGPQTRAVDLVRSYKTLASQKQLESCAIECDSHVDESEMSS